MSAGTPEMDETRRYTREEIERIFERAAHDDAARRTDLEREGMSLAELREIADEVGIPADRIEAAARELEPPASLAPAGTPLAVSRRRGGLLDRVLGSRVFPLRVRVEVPLPRRPTDAEWERMVDDLRGVFRARGHDYSVGDVREWTHSRLYALIERQGDDWRLTMGSTKGDTAGLVIAGGSALVAGAAAAVAPVLVGGVAVLGYAVARLPRWAHRRRTQMATLAEHWVEMLQEPPQDA